MTFRQVISENQSKAALEGAEVYLNRAFGFGDPSEIDPFSLHFRNDDPQKYSKGSSGTHIAASR